MRHAIRAVQYRASVICHFVVLSPLSRLAAGPANPSTWDRVRRDGRRTLSAGVRFSTQHRDYNNT